MSASDPTKKNQKTQGVSKRILVVDYLPTQAILDTLDYALPFQDSIKDFQEYDKNSTGPYTKNTSDMFRYYTGRYFRNFPKSLKNEAPTYPLGNRFYNPSVFPAPIVDPQGDFKVADEGTFPDNIIWIETTTYPKFMFYDYRGNQKTTWLNLRQGTNSKKNPNYSPFWAFLSGYVNENPSGASNLFSQLTNQQTIVIVYDKFGETHEGYLTDQRNINTYEDFKKFINGFQESGNSVRMGSLNFNNSLGVYHSDHTCDYDFPVSKGEVEKTQIPVKTLYGHVGEEYNFYIDSYEKILQDLKMDNNHLERLLPNINIIMGANASEKKYNELSIPYRRMISLDEFYLKNYVDGLDRLDFGQYFLQWSKTFSEKKTKILDHITKSKKSKAQVYQKNKNLVIPPEEMKNIVEYQKNKDLFPMYTEIEFSTDTNSKLSQPLIQSNLWASLLSYVIMINDYANFPTVDFGPQGKILYGIKSSAIPFKGYAEQDVAIKDDETYNTKMEQISANDFDKFNTKTIDLLDWVEKSKQHGHLFASYGQDNLAHKYMLINADSNIFNTFKQYNKNSVFQKIMHAGFRAKLKKLIKENMRSYAGIITGAKCYNETLFYKVQKSNPETGEIIQNFWFVNNPEIDVINYIDTQVMYDREYEYKIFSWQLVIGNSYNYGKPTLGSEMPDSGLTDAALAEDHPATLSKFDAFVGELDSQNEFAAMVEVLNMPSIKLVEMPYYEPAPIKVLDDPPVPPGASVVPYRAISDRVLLTLSQETGEYLLDPVYLTSEEFQKIEDYRKAKGYESDEKILYRSDDHFGNFEIFRTTIKPMSYDEFSDKKIVSLPQGQDTFIDSNIQPNTKYYYMFRVIDIHGHISNPSPIYEFELVKNLESVYPTVRVLQMEDIKEEQYSKSKETKKSFKKYFRITPAETQISLNYNNLEEDLTDSFSATDLQPNIGIEQDPVVGKKFKIRLTSKQTGRQVDFNLTFKASWDGNKIVKVD